MKAFRVRGDFVFIDAEGRHASFPLADFQAMEPKFKMPEGCVHLEYQPPHLHVKMDKNYNQTQGEEEYPEYENYIKKIDDYIRASELNKESELGHPEHN